MFVNMTVRDLTTDWIRLQGVEQDSPEAEDLMWAAKELTLSALRSPEKCWTAILEIMHATEDEWVLINLAAGPLENLLALNPHDALNWIEAEIPQNPKLKKLLNVQRG